jgi:hypothetical protein
MGERGTLHTNSGTRYTAVHSSSLSELVWGDCWIV